MGKGSACDSVVCICPASASLNKQSWGWALLCGVFTVEPGRGGERVRRGRGPSPSTTAPPASAGRAAGGKRPERSSEARNRWGGGVGSGDLLRWGCFSVWQLLLAASPLEKGYPPPSVPGPQCPLAPSKSGRELVEVRVALMRADAPGPSLAHLLLPAERDRVPDSLRPGPGHSWHFSQRPPFRNCSSFSGPLPGGRS